MGLLFIFSILLAPRHVVSITQASNVSEASTPTPGDLTVVIGGERYHVMTVMETMTWQEAHDLCQDVGGHLPAFLSGDDHKAVIVTSPAEDILGTRFWTGWNKFGDGSTWKEEANEEVLAEDSAIWSSNEPNNHGGNEYCTMGKVNDGGFFLKDFKCHEQLFVQCISKDTMLHENVTSIGDPELKDFLRVNHYSKAPKAYDCFYVLSMIDASSDSGFLWFCQRAETIEFVEVIIQLTNTMLTLVLNGFFVGCFALIKATRDASTCLIVFQSLCDILSVGLFQTFHVVPVLLNSEIREYLTGGDTWHWSDIPLICNQEPCRSWPVRIINWMFQSSWNLKYSINDYSTGTVLLALAAIRYILVCRPFDKNVLLSRTRLIILNSVIIGGSLVLLALTLVVTRHKPSDFKSFYGSESLRVYVETLLIYILPISVCAVLYFKVIQRLGRRVNLQGRSPPRKELKRQSRNAVITKCLLTTTVLWAILWLPGRVMQFRIYVLGFDPFTEEATKLDWVLYLFMDELYLLYSVVNPMIYIALNRRLQEPIRRHLFCLHSARQPVEISKATFD